MSPNPYNNGLFTRKPSPLHHTPSPAPYEWPPCRRHLYNESRACHVPCPLKSPPFHAQTFSIPPLAPPEVIRPPLEPPAPPLPPPPAQPPTTIRLSKPCNSPRLPPARRRPRTTKTDKRLEPWRAHRGMGGEQTSTVPNLNLNERERETYVTLRFRAVYSLGVRISKWE